MNHPVKDPEVIIAALKAASPSAAGDAIVLQAQALVAGELQHLDIAIQTDLAPAVAIALLNSTASARSRRQPLDPALLCIAAGVAPASTAANVRIQLLFEAGQREERPHRPRAIQPRADGGRAHAALRAGAQGDRTLLRAHRNAAGKARRGETVALIEASRIG